MWFGCYPTRGQILSWFSVDFTESSFGALKSSDSFHLSAWGSKYFSPAKKYVLVLLSTAAPWIWALLKTNQTEQQIALKELILIQKKRNVSYHVQRLSCFHYPAPAACSVVQYTCDTPQSYQSEINRRNTFLELGRNKGNSKGQQSLQNRTVPKQTNCMS